jgi:hypothetical protein
MRKISMNLPISGAKIEISFKDRAGSVRLSFNNVQELAEFLKSHCPIAEALGYIKKQPVNISAEEQEIRNVMGQFLKNTYQSSLKTPMGQRLCIEKRLIERWGDGWVISELGNLYLKTLEK